MVQTSLQSTGMFRESKVLVAKLKRNQIICLDNDNIWESICHLVIVNVGVMKNIGIIPF